PETAGKNREGSDGNNPKERLDSFPSSTDLSRAAHLLRQKAEVRRMRGRKLVSGLVAQGPGKGPESIGQKAPQREGGFIASLGSCRTTEPGRSNRRTACSAALSFYPRPFGPGRGVWSTSREPRNPERVHGSVPTALAYSRPYSHRRPSPP